MIGKVFSRLIVLSLFGTNKHRQRVWNCLCECGTITQVATLSLNNGNTQSCGCLGRDSTSERFTIHGLSHSRLYQIWNGMVKRCYNSKSESYQHYGLRGIIICDAWRDDFLAFYNWALVNGYRDDLTIDRIDVNGNYEPNNCRWATYDEQAHNRRNAVLTEDDVRAIRKDARVLREIAADYGIACNTVSNIKNRNRWKDVW